MKLSKAREIVQLNIKEASKKMPPDCLDALKLLDEAAKRLEQWRGLGIPEDLELLPGETPEN